MLAILGMRLATGGSKISCAPAGARGYLAVTHPMAALALRACHGLKAFAAAAANPTKNNFHPLRDNPLRAMWSDGVAADIVRGPIIGTLKVSCAGQIGR